MVHKIKLLHKIAASVAFPAVLAAISAWIICWLYPRPFSGAFWPSLGGGLLVKFVLETFNLIEASVVTAVFLLLSVVSIPAAARFQMSALPAFAIASLASGMLTSRVTYHMSRGEW